MTDSFCSIASQLVLRFLESSFCFEKPFQTINQQIQLQNNSQQHFFLILFFVFFFWLAKCLRKKGKHTKMRTAETIIGIEVSQKQFLFWIAFPDHQINIIDTTINPAPSLSFSFFDCKIYKNKNNNPGEEHSNIPVWVAVTTEMRKKGCFLDWVLSTQTAFLGYNHPLSRKKCAFSDFC